MTKSLVDCDLAEVEKRVLAQLTPEAKQQLREYADMLGEFSPSKEDRQIATSINALLDWHEASK